MEWLNQNPVTEFYDVEYLTMMADKRKMLATQPNAAKKYNEEAVDDWKGKIPMLRVDEALVQNDDAKRAFLRRRDIDPGHHAVDSHNSIEKWHLTVWEMVSDWWLDPGFNPVSERVSDLHTDYLDEIDLGYEKVTTMHKATPEYIEQ